MQSGLRRLFVWKYRDGRLLKPWLQVLAAKAAARERPELAARLLAQVARIFVEHGCCEVLNGCKGKPHRFFLTRTEKRFTAAAALYLEAAAAVASSVTRKPDRVDRGPAGEGFSYPASNSVPNSWAERGRGFRIHRSSPHCR